MEIFVISAKLLSGNIRLLSVMHVRMYVLYKGQTKHSPFTDILEINFWKRAILI